MRKSINYKNRSSGSDSGLANSNIYNGSISAKARPRSTASASARTFRWRKTRGRFGDALQAVVKELTDLHRYQVTQKLGGGRLNIQVEEAADPKPFGRRVR